MEHPRCARCTQCFRCDNIGGRFTSTLCRQCAKNQMARDLYECVKVYALRKDSSGQRARDVLNQHKDMIRSYFDS